MSALRTPRPRRGVVGVALTTAVLLAATACTSSSGSNTSSSSGGSSSGSKALRIGYTGQTTPNFDPASSNNYFQQIYPAYDTLLHVDSKGTLQPWLATSWKFTTPTTLELKLRSDVTFTDGTKFDASAVKANLEYARDAKQGSQFQSYLKPITDVKVVDATTADVVLSSPNPGLPFDLSQAAGEMISPKAIANPQSLGTAPAGSGPYILDSSQTKSGVSVAWKRNPSYWATSQNVYPFDEIVYSVASDPTATRNAALAGNVDVLTLETSKDAVNGFTTLKSLSGGAGGFTGIWLDVSGKTQKALADARVRLAINYAIDSDTIAKTVYEGDAVPVKAVPVTQDSAAYSSQLDSVFSYDPNKAKQLLSEAGYASGFPMTIIAPPQAQTYGEAMAANLRAVGINATIKTFTGADIVQATLSGTYQAGLLLSTPTGIATQDFAGLFTSTAFFNVNKVDDPKMDGLLKQAAEEQDDTKRNADYQALAVYAAGQSWVAGALMLQQVNSYNPKAVSLTPPPFGSIFPYDYQLPTS